MYVCILYMNIQYIYDVFVTHACLGTVHTQL